MSEEKKTVEIEIYKKDSVVNLTLPTLYVQRFNQLMLEFLPFKDEEHFQTVLKNVSDNKIEGPFEYHMETIMSFLTLVEDAARQQNLLEKIQINPEDYVNKSNED
jgi:hypothetical protein